MEFYSGLGPSHSMPGKAEEIERRQEFASLHSFQWVISLTLSRRIYLANPLILVPLTPMNSRDAIHSSFVGTNRGEPRYLDLRLIHPNRGADRSCAQCPQRMHTGEQKEKKVGQGKCTSSGSGSRAEYQGGKDHKDSLSQVQTSLKKHCRRCRFAGRVRTSMLLGLWTSFCFSRQ
jgi:hypothetical protein